MDLLHAFTWYLGVVTAIQMSLLLFGLWVERQAKGCDDNRPFWRSRLVMTVKRNPGTLLRYLAFPLLLYVILFCLWCYVKYILLRGQVLTISELLRFPWSFWCLGVATLFLIFVDIASVARTLRSRSLEQELKLIQSAKQGNWLLVKEVKVRSVLGYVIVQTAIRDTLKVAVGVSLAIATFLSQHAIPLWAANTLIFIVVVLSLYRTGRLYALCARLAGLS